MEVKNKLIIGLLLIAQVSGVIAFNGAERDAWIGSQIRTYNEKFKKLSPALKAEYTALVNANVAAYNAFITVNYSKIKHSQEEKEATSNAYMKTQTKLDSFRNAHGLIIFG